VPLGNLRTRSQELICIAITALSQSPCASVHERDGRHAGEPEFLHSGNTASAGQHAKLEGCLTEQQVWQAVTFLSHMQVSRDHHSALRRLSVRVSAKLPCF